MLFSLKTPWPFLTMAWVISQRYRRRRRPEPHLEKLSRVVCQRSTFTCGTRPGIQVILTRNFVCSLFIAAVPAPGAGRGLASICGSQAEPSRAGVHQHGNRIASGRRLDFFLTLAPKPAQNTLNDFWLASWLVVVLVLLSIVPNLWMFFARLPRPWPASVWTVKALRTLDRRTTGNARLGPRTDERCLNLMGLTRPGVALGGVLWGGGRDVPRPRSNAGGGAPCS